MITVGQILKPQGLRGEIKVKPLTSDPSRFCVLKSVYVGGVPHRVEGVRMQAGDVYMRLSGVPDRTAAESLRGAFIEIDRAAAIDLTDGEFFIADLVGATLLARRDGGVEHIGSIRRIDSYGAADVFTVATERGEMTLAFVKALMPEFDGGSHTLTVDGKKLDEVAVYED